mmetsp:Transcript_34123/g.106247  ORF Transcript_34123/g.106247 Transcript_34123/m.106247 type:complete len:252 (+) Transcript_34123:208-963(+)
MAHPTSATPESSDCRSTPPSMCRGAAPPGGLRGHSGRRRRPAPKRPHPRRAAAAATPSPASAADRSARAGGASGPRAGASQRPGRRSRRRRRRCTRCGASRPRTDRRPAARCRRPAALARQRLCFPTSCRGHARRGPPATPVGPSAVPCAVNPQLQQAATALPAAPRPMAAGAAAAAAAAAAPQSAAAAPLLGGAVAAVGDPQLWAGGGCRGLLAAPLQTPAAAAEGWMPRGSPPTSTARRQRPAPCWRPA